MTGKVLCYLLALLLVRCYSFNVPGCIRNFRPISPLFGAKGVRSGVPKFVRVYRKIEGKVEDDPLFPMIEQIARTADLRKATSVKAFRVAHMTELADFIMLIEGSNNRQISAIASSIEVCTARSIIICDQKCLKLVVVTYMAGGCRGKVQRKALWQRRYCSQRLVRSRLRYVYHLLLFTPYLLTLTLHLVCLCTGLGSVIAHVMTPAMSNFYKLEKKWLDGEVSDSNTCITLTLCCFVI